MANRIPPPLQPVFDVRLGMGRRHTLGRGPGHVPRLPLVGLEASGGAGWVAVVAWNVSEVVP